jgi:hypothetical protein
MIYELARDKVTTVLERAAELTGHHAISCLLHFKLV